jgi:hypothetical protein
VSRLHCLARSQDSADSSLPKQVQVYLYLLATAIKDDSLSTALDDDSDVIPTELRNAGLKILRNARDDSRNAIDDSEPALG